MPFPGTRPTSPDSAERHLDSTSSAACHRIPRRSRRADHTVDLDGRRHPPAPDTHLVRLERWRRPTFTGAPKVPARALYSFTGTFEAVEADAGTRVTHGYDIAFRRPLAALFDSAVQRWLEGELDREIGRLQESL